MRILYFILFMLFSNLINAQNKQAGEYYNYFGSNLKLNEDFTFNYTWRFDLSASWTDGTWKILNDTVYLTMVPVFDTFRYKENKANQIKDSLILSMDKKPEIITNLISNVLQSGGQNISACPKKLFYKKNKLIDINKNGKLITEKTKGFWSAKKYVPWFIKK